MQEIQKLIELQNQIAHLEEQVKEIRQDIEMQVTEADGQKLSGDWGEAKMVFVPKWQYSVELSDKKKMTLARLKLAEKEEQTTGKAQKISDGGRLVIKLNK